MSSGFVKNRKLDRPFDCAFHRNKFHMRNRSCSKGHISLLVALRSNCSSFPDTNRRTWVYVYFHHFFGFFEEKNFSRRKKNPCSDFRKHEISRRCFHDEKNYFWNFAYRRIGRACSFFSVLPRNALRRRTFLFGFPFGFRFLQCGF